ncbi:glycosyltransferase family 1 protein [Flavobacterium sp.]|uniref:glycosyltransferase family 4 protein n=1 Tax=Flavobacterium sp. TaxID=239 RepID=UPI002C1D47AB|nr:glycosyltransferase family 1 protein [Flavobacterium sp.]HSD07319.1 glycosyltransferase family 1 protein [Flavobacterium sp.]
MKILYDHKIFTTQKYGGISRYFFELIKRFDGVENRCEVATLFSDNAYYNDKLNPKLNRILPNSQFKGKKRITSYLNTRKSMSEVRCGNFDVFHPTYYDDYFLDSIKGKPFVVTFYDMIHEKFSSQFSSLEADSRLFENKRLMLENSSKIISISETTKQDIIDLFDADPSKIDVVYLGNSLQNFDIGNQRLVNEEYILFVGNREIYKNFHFFITTVAESLIDNDLKLVCAGGGDFTFSENELFRTLKIENRVIFKRIFDDNVLANYYSNALFFCFPSLYEGFGIPVLESFACGCPALLSNGGALPEVGGNAAMYFDPTNVQSLRNAVDELINNQSLRQSLEEKGSSRLNKFSWDKTYKDHLEVYKTVV